MQASSHSKGVLHLSWKIVKDENEGDELEHSKIKVAKCIKRECKQMKFESTHYDLHINKDKIDNPVSQTLSSMLPLVSQKLNKTLSAVIIENITTQIALGLLTRDSKKVVDKLYDYRVTCSYDEVVRFKKEVCCPCFLYRHQCLGNLSHGYWSYPDHC